MFMSIKQLFRTPVKVILFFLLLASSTALLVLGTNLWLDTKQKVDQVEEKFTTIGTVQQIENATKTSGVWDASWEEYTYFINPVYDSVISSDVLDFEGAEYVGTPEQRPYYFAYLPEYARRSEGYIPVAQNTLIAEFEPLEDCVPSKPVQVKIKNVLFGNDQNSEGFWFCDHITETPEPLEKGKTYIAVLAPGAGLHPELPEEQNKVELAACYLPYSSQYDTNGKKLEDDFTPEPRANGNTKKWEEVTPDFYEEGGRGQYWLKLVEDFKRRDSYYKVLPTGNLELLPSFHSGETQIRDGRKFTKEEIEEGKAVCLVSFSFATTNNVRVGDTLPLSLFASNYAYAPSQNIAYTNLNAIGEAYETFWFAEYEIVGTYISTVTGLSDPNKIEMADDLIIIPDTSVKASDENNIVDFGVMRASTTSFQIPNGTIAEFTEAFNKAVPESAFLAISFDDGGYEQVIGSLNQMRSFAILLFAIGLFSVLAVIILLLYFFILRQRKRTAIERSLGMTRHACRVSLISGVLLLSVIAILVGSFSSTLLVERVSEFDLAGQNETGYNTKYTIGIADDSAQSVLDDIDGEQPLADSAWTLYLSLTICGVLILFTWICAWFLVNHNLKIEPLLLLGAREE